jgi:hypothetical protein
MTTLPTSMSVKQQADGQLQQLSALTQYVQSLAENIESFDAVAKLKEYDREKGTKLFVEAKKIAAGFKMTGPQELVAIGAGILEKYGQSARSITANTNLAQAALSDDAFADFFLSIKGVDLRRSLIVAWWKRPLISLFPSLDPLRATVFSMGSLLKSLEAHKITMRGQQRELVSFMTVYEGIDKTASEAYPAVLKFAAVFQLIYERETSVLNALAEKMQKGGLEAQSKYMRQSMMLVSVNERKLKFAESASRLWIMRNVVTIANGIAMITFSSLDYICDFTMTDIEVGMGMLIMNALQSKVLDAMQRTDAAAKEITHAMIEKVAGNTRGLRKYLSNLGDLTSYFEWLDDVTDTQKDMIQMRKDLEMRVEAFERASRAMEIGSAEMIRKAHDENVAIEGQIPDPNLK